MFPWKERIGERKYLHLTPFKKKTQTEVSVTMEDGRLGSRGGRARENPFFPRSSPYLVSPGLFTIRWPVWCPYAADVCGFSLSLPA